RGESARPGGEDRHRVGVLGEAVEEAPHLLVDQAVARDAVPELLELIGGGQLAVDQQVGDLQEGALLRQLLDRVAAVAQDPGIPVQVGDGARARAGVAVPVVERDQSGPFAKIADIDSVVAGGAADQRQLDAASVQAQRGSVWNAHRLVGHQISSFTASRSSSSSLQVASTRSCAHSPWSMPGTISTWPG